MTFCYYSVNLLNSIKNMSSRERDRGINNFVKSRRPEKVGSKDNKTLTEGFSTEIGHIDILNFTDIRIVNQGLFYKFCPIKTASHFEVLIRNISVQVL